MQKTTLLHQFFLEIQPIFGSRDQPKFFKSTEDFHDIVSAYQKSGDLIILF